MKVMCTSLVFNNYAFVRQVKPWLPHLITDVGIGFVRGYSVFSGKGEPSLRLTEAIVDSLEHGVADCGVVKLLMVVSDQLESLYQTHEELAEFGIRYW